jgi:hypothetical protein
MINQWLNFWEDTLPSVDFDAQWQDTQNLFREGVRLYDACMTYSLARMQPDTWTEATAGITETWATSARDWLQSTGLAGGNSNSAASETLTALQERVEESEDRVAKANSEITSLKRTLTLQKKSLAKQMELTEDSRKAAKARDEQIGDLEKEIQRLSGMLGQLEKKPK